MNYTAWVSMCSYQEVVLLGKEFRTGFRRSSAVRFFFWHPQELPQFRVFYKTKESPIHSFLKQCCSCLEKAGSEQQRKCTSALARPFPCHAVRCTDGLWMPFVPVHGAVFCHRATLPFISWLQRAVTQIAAPPLQK